MPLETPVVVVPAPVIPAAPAAVVPPVAPVEDPNIFYDILREVTSDEPPAPVIPAPVAPAPAPVVPAPAAPAAPAVKKKVTVREPAPQPSVEEIVRKTIEAQTPAPKPPVVPAPVTDVPLEIPEGLLNEEENEEVQLAIYAEKKDPTRKGLAKQFLDFHVANRKFLDEAVAKDPEFDPTKDAEYKKFLTKNEPKVSATEKRKLFVQREVDAAEERAYQRVRGELAPELEATKNRLHEITTRPDVVRQVSAVESAVFKGVEDPAFKAFVEKGEAAVEDFPIEVEILQAQKQHTVRLAEEFLAIRTSLKPFTPADPAHAEISRFINEQGDAFVKHGKHLVRDGKPFVHPSQWKPAMATTHWTFSNDDILGALQVDAARKAQTRIQSEHTRIEKAVAAKTKRTAAAPVGAPPVEEPSPRAAAGAPAAAAPVAPAGDLAYNLLRPQ